MEKIDQVDAQIINILKEHECKLGYEMTFPRYKIIPDEVKLAMLVLKNHGMVIQMTIQELSK